MADLHDVVVDARHPASIARFWAFVLDSYAIAPYDDEELERLRGEGVDDPEDDPSVLLEPGSGAGPRLFFQRVPEPKAGKNRVHLDLRCDDLDAEVSRLVEHGAQVRSTRDDWVVLIDPEGNEFCLSPR